MGVLIVEVTLDRVRNCHTLASGVTPRSLAVSVRMWDVVAGYPHVLENVGTVAKKVANGCSHVLANVSAWST